MGTDEPDANAERDSDTDEEPLRLTGPSVPRWMAGVALLALVASALLTAWLVLSP